MNRLGTYSALFLIAGSQAGAQSWEFRLTPYYWSAGVDSSAIVDDEDADSSGSITDFLDSGLLLTGEARRGLFTIFGEYNWLDFRNDVNSPGPFLDLEARLAGRMMALGAGYAVHDDGRARIELGAGARYWDMKYEVDVNGKFKPGVQDRFTDPYIAVRGDFDITDRWEIAGEASAGGFGVGSELTTDLNLRTSYAITDHLGGVLGYRYLSVELGDSSALSDFTFYGPYIGIDLRF